MEPHVTFETNDAVAELVLRRPEKRNAITADMWHQIIAGLAALGEDATVRALVVRGEGGSFSSGADLADVRDSNGEESVTYRALAEDGLRAVREFGRPTVAAIDGHCIGAGYVLALACDIRVATTRSSFALPAVRYGFSVEAAGLQRLVQLVGPGRASKFLLCAASIGGVEAERGGFIEVCDDDADGVARSIAIAISNADSGAVEHTRQAILAAADGR